MGPRAFIAFILSVLISQTAAAKYNYDLGLGLQTFSGKDEESLAPGSGYLLRLGAQAGEGIFRWTTGLYVMRSSGEAGFNDNGSPVDLKYSLSGGEFNLGFIVYPLGNETKLKLQPFLAAAGAAHLASLTFDKNASVSADFAKSDSSMLFGYGLTVGADYALSKEWGAKLYVERSQISGSLAGSSFSLSGQRLMIGFYFR